MRKIILFVLLFSFILTSQVFPDNFERKTTWATGDLITASKLNADLDEAARILGDNNDGLISNGNVKATAAIVESKISFNTSTGHFHDGSGSRTLTAAQLSGLEHVSARTFRIGAELAHTDSNWDIQVTSATNRPAIRFNGVDSGNGAWEISNDGVTFATISTSSVNYKVGSFTRDVSTATGTQSVTGLGFRPVSIMFFAGDTAGANPWASVGGDNVLSAISTYDTHGQTANTWGAQNAYSITIVTTTNDKYEGKISSFDSDGFTVSWLKTGTQTGTVTIGYIAY